MENRIGNHILPINDASLPTRLLSHFRTRRNVIRSIQGLDSVFTSWLSLPLDSPWHLFTSLLVIRVDDIWARLRVGSTGLRPRVLLACVTCFITSR
jgi:hypothetical protein